MNSDYDFCKHEGCKKKVLNATGLCQEHRKQKCSWYQCTTIITSRQGAQYCEKHMKVRAREMTETWSVEV